MSIRTSVSKISIAAPADKVWAALTKPALVKQWQYGSDVVTDWHVGSPIRFRTEWQGQVYEQWGTVLAVEAPTTIKYSLFAPRPGLEDVPENYFTMIYTLKEQAGETELTFTQEDPRELPGGEVQENAEAEETNPILTSLKQLVEAGQ